MTDLAYPDAEAALYDILSREGSPAHPTLILQVDDYGVLAGPFPIAHIITLPTGRESYIDRTDDIQVDVYTQGEFARPAAEDVRRFVCGEQIATSYGFIDEVSTTSMPSNRDSFYDRIHKASMTLKVVSRPLETFA